MIDERRYLIVSMDEYEYIKKQFDKKGSNLVNKVMRFRNFTHWKYEISMPFMLRDTSSVFNSMTFTGNHEMIGYGSGDNFDDAPEQPIQCIAKVNLLDVGSTLKARITVDCPEIAALSGIKHIGRHIFTYEENGNIKLVPAGEDSPSHKSASIKMSHVFMTTLLYKLWAEENKVTFKSLYGLGTNVVKLNSTQMRDIMEESKKCDLEMFCLVDYPLQELTIISEGMFRSGKYNNQSFYGIQYIYYTVLHNDDTLWTVGIKSYLETAVSERHLYFNAEITGLKGDDELEVAILEDNIKLDETVRMAKEQGKDLSEVDLDEYINSEHIIQKQLLASQALLVFQYIMYCMAKPKKTILREVKETKKSPTRKKSHEKLRDEVTVLIKNTGYVAPRKPVMNPGSGSKHSYEYERRGGWCTRHDTGKKYWRKGATCCKGRGTKATHVYEIRSEEDETDN